MFEQYLEIFFAFAKAFAVGGLICMIAQIVINFTDLTAGKILVMFMLTGLVLQGLGVYQYLVDFAGAGASVPLTGFGSNLAKGVKEAITKDGFIGIFTGGLKATAGGITVAIFAGLLASLIFKAKDKS